MTDAMEKDVLVYYDEKETVRSTLCDLRHIDSTWVRYVTPGGSDISIPAHRVLKVKHRRVAE